MPYLAVYGTLRKGEYNHTRFPLQAVEELENPITLKGFQLYDLGYYPCAVFTGNENDEIVVEIYQISEGVKKHIDMMEFRAGYNIRSVKINEDISASIYVYDNIPNSPLIKSGDYANR